MRERDASALFYVRGAISSLEPEQQYEVLQMAEAVRMAVSRASHRDFAMLAVSLISAEHEAEERGYKPSVYAN